MKSALPLPQVTHDAAPRRFEIRPAGDAAPRSSVTRWRATASFSTTPSSRTNCAARASPHTSSAPRWRRRAGPDGRLSPPAPTSPLLSNATPNQIRERVNTGLAAAKERGVKLGRPPKLQARAPEVMELKDQGLGIRAISRTLGIPVSSVHSLVEWAERGWSSVLLNQRPDMVLHGCLDEARCFGPGRASVQMSGV
jgi:hypothetical protein